MKNSTFKTIARITALLLLITVTAILNAQIYEKMPVFPGGNDSLLNFIRKNLRLDPKIENGHGIPGKVIVRFVVSKTGEVTNVGVVRSLNPACDKEAIRVVKLLPKFTPGEQNGKKVDVWYTLPVFFKL